jgi:hypothetical protein
VVTGAVVTGAVVSGAEVIGSVVTRATRSVTVVAGAAFPDLLYRRRR